MPLNSHTNNTDIIKQTGRLYIVATPIGNMDDITIRARQILSQADIIAAEDTRTTGKLLAFHNIKKQQIISYHEHNEKEKTPGLVNKMKAGLSVALVSDAGTPSVSDPGYRLLIEAIANNIQIIPVPGVSAAITALSVSGLPTDTFIFVGFLPKKKGKRTEQLKNLAKENRTIIFYESPKRIAKRLEELLEILGDRNGVLAREMTKTYEEFIRGSISEILHTIKKRPAVKGECTLIISGNKGNGADVSENTLREEIMNALEKKDVRSSHFAKDIALKLGLPKKIVYTEILKIKGKK